MTASEIITLLALERHPEGGWFRQTFRDDVPGMRAYSTLIYYLLEAGDRSAWHRIDSAEVWHWYAGAPLELKVGTASMVLGNDFHAGQRPQGVVRRGEWQSARSLGDWTLVGCTVAPGFEFEHFELAPPGWRPG
ncbi:MAG TPA: cupin domain-containing protein [Devosia sp.]|nr:cupin domain-containing protein [Devosia sp.]